MKTNHQKRKNRWDIFGNRNIRKIGLFIAVALIATALIFVVLQPPQSTHLVVEHDESVMARPVKVANLIPSEYQSVVTAYGDVRPEWEVTLRAKVQGDILNVSPNFRVGHMVSKGKVLLEIDSLPSQVLVEETKLALEQAKLALMIEQKEGTEAKQAWENSGILGDPTSPLVLRNPYLKAAQSTLSASEAALAHAMQQLQYCRVQAPFDALVVSRSVSLGGELFAGDEVCTLYGSNKAVVACAIDKHQWNQLPREWMGLDVQLLDTELKTKWQGTLAREGQYYDPASRLRMLFVEVDEPFRQEKPLLPGSFVELRIQGRKVAQLLQIPESARTQKGQIWLVDDRNQLQAYTVATEFSRDGYLYVKSPVDSEARVVLYPNNSFTNGLVVTPIEKE